MDVGSSSGASSSDVLASGSGVATAGGVFCFCAGGFGGFGLQISATSAGRSSGGARATDAISAAVGLTSPESTFCRVPGTASSAASTPFAKCSALRTKLSVVFVSRAILARVFSFFWLVVILTTNQTCILVSPFFIWYQSLFSFILLSYKVLLLFWGEVASP